MGHFSSKEKEEGGTTPQQLNVHNKALEKDNWGLYDIFYVCVH